jgi:hypothetical protein
VPIFVIDDVQRMFTKAGGAAAGFSQVPLIPSPSITFSFHFDDVSLFFLPKDHYLNL